jgi:hypothetical protein
VQSNQKRQAERSRLTGHSTNQQTTQFLINKTINQHRTNEGEEGATETKAKLFDETKLSDNGGED